VAFLENGAALLTTNPMSPAWVDRVKACLGERFRPCLPASPTSRSAFIRTAGANRNPSA
jgi:hypothetical protein